MNMAPDTAALADENAIRRLYAFYVDAANSIDFVRAASVYAPDAHLSVMGAPDIVGREAIGEALRQTFVTFEMIHQVCHAIVIDVKGDRAVGRCSIYELNFRPGETTMSMFFGGYEDQLVKRPEGWRFSRRDLRVRVRTMIETSKLKLMPSVPHGLEFSI
jgi:hypothetical protein